MNNDDDNNNNQNMNNNNNNNDDNDHNSPKRLLDSESDPTKTLVLDTNEKPITSMSSNNNINKSLISPYNNLKQRSSIPNINNNMDELIEEINKYESN